MTDPKTANDTGSNPELTGLHLDEITDFLKAPGDEEEIVNEQDQGEIVNEEEGGQTTNSTS